MEHDLKNNSKSFLSNDYRTSGAHFSQESLQRHREQEEDFLNQEIDYRNFVFAPEGYEGIVFSIYLVVLPYLIGLGFLFLFIARSSYEVFLEFNLGSYFIIWAIGYEVSAILVLIGIFIVWLNHYRNRYEREKRRKSGNKPKY
jgi:hypothetical protein